MFFKNNRGEWLGYWWRVRESNSWPSGCDPDALPTELTPRKRSDYHSRTGNFRASVHDLEFLGTTGTIIGPERLSP